MSLEDNTKQVNRIIARTLGWCFFAILGLMITTWSGIFHFKGNLKAIIVIAGTACTLVPGVLERIKVDDTFLKYYMLIALSLLIGLLGCNNGVGIYITYALVPIASCLYFDRRFIIHMGIISYLTMTLGVYVNTAGKLEVRFLNWSHMIAFRNYMIGFTFEYVCVMLFLYQIVSRAQNFMEAQQENLKVLQEENIRRDKVASLYKNTLSAQKRTSFDLISDANLTVEDYTRLTAGHQYLAGLQGILNYSDNINSAYDRVFESLGQYFGLDRIMYMEPEPTKTLDQLLFQWCRHEGDRLYDFYTELPLDEMAQISNTYDRCGYIEYGRDYLEREDCIDNGLTHYMLSKMLGRHLWLPTVSDGNYYGAFCFDKRDESKYNPVDIFLLSEVVNLMSVHMVRQRADEANKAKSVFLSTMSHEIRTPMNAIIGMTTVSLREEMSDTLRRNMMIIKSSAEGLLGIINDILDFSKIESGKIDLVLEDYNTASLLEDIKVMVKARNEEKNLNIIFDFDEKLPRVLHGDMVRIKQVMINLCTNAIKYTAEGSVEIKISSEMLEEKIANIIFSVKDTGQGIKDSDKENLFKTFSQVNQQQNHHTEGTGLGLAISKQLVELMHGEIGCESEFGAGSTFHFSVPQKVVDFSTISTEDVSVSAVSDEEISFTTKDCRVLIVDDNIVNILVAQELLTPFNFSIQTETSGKAAIELTEKETFDLIFMDHFMPEMDGEEVTKAIRRDYYNLNKDVPIIALTADAVQGSREKMLDAGMNDVLSKPINLTEAMKIFKRYLPKEKMVPLK